MSLSDRSYSEKRDFIRMQIDSKAILRTNGEEIDAICRDLSSTGLQIEAKSHVKEGDKVIVVIPSEHPELQGLEAEAEVIRVTSLEQGSQLLGLSILSMN
ncbi:MULTISPECIES: PilZ domain-containing protein [Pseudomonas]|uniref:PilZ domain-containing protein n=1 Tax=Pseudomonas lutea TaxID=243924 RepID=A0A9X8MB75_9PSED|nr:MULTISPECIES: PilZ domain-containing protein [Pseudomonas]AYN94176.1 PilZ domain-containing protein [Pseudomonas sp. LTJR-52]MBA1246777.1 PilZ domain-containing protein [Pseudomonas zeshuii]MBW5413729.1 PilZ domain-containing protein [Pseudomonas sp. MAG002Y]MDN3237402.1 PilZ domain-containing protein [Pseudomonas sp. WAC2]QEU28582.1 PilZ domain-containing protein [Pseudomonas luteola]